MKRTIKNPYLEVTINKSGAEICSIKGRSGREYIWGGYSNVWGRHAPVLFPIVGKLKDNSYSYDGKNYTMGQHGFARDNEFQLLHADEEGLSCQLLSTPETKAVYPFEFSLIINYRLIENSLEIEYLVTNNSDSVMPFSIGAHPGFNLTWGDDDNVEDYYIEFQKNETLDTYFLNENSLLSDETLRILDNENVLPLRADLFDRDALVFLDFKSGNISLCSKKHKGKVTIGCEGFPYLGIWAKPNAPYVCIEPWYGYADPAGVDGNIMNKPGIIKLDPGKEFSCVHRINISE